MAGGWWRRPRQLPRNAHHLRIKVGSEAAAWRWPRPGPRIHCSAVAPPLPAEAHSLTQQARRTRLFHHRRHLLRYREDQCRRMITDMLCCMFCGRAFLSGCEGGAKLMHPPPDALPHYDLCNAFTHSFTKRAGKWAACPECYTSVQQVSSAGWVLAG